ncbi:hypothetical protein SAMN05428642_102877 [Flaviramulus basaltis]|uniref:Lipocalin-like domain-containing protein n=1 Tax=Flaviramulus basaltis TaxID=369401 RepID=A0A1K2IJW4_9FLAO|nr:hypothetical protein [Flaviramulus basaltis]SFZ92679.1 hypothetical protein SAMN05428642_102877 [Flaviramulus basaltis]
MKKQNILIGILILLLILSCSSSNDFDPLIGVWKPIKHGETFNNNHFVEYDIYDCNKNSRYSYFNDGSLNIELFEELEGVCKKLSNPIFISGNWKKNTNEAITL